jgi:hypothetical protein
MMVDGFDSSVCNIDFDVCDSIVNVGKVCRWRDGLSCWLDINDRCSRLHWQQVINTIVM